MQTFDLAIIESQFNGGDAQLMGNDLAVVFGIQNMIYLGLFGGNLESVTEPVVVQAESLDFWGNNLFLKDNPSAQFNSLTEKTINTVSLTSQGRTLIENAVKEDLKFFSDLGATVTVTVDIVSHDHLSINIRVVLESGSSKVVIINFRKQSDGDFFAPDFNEDFYI